MITVDRVAKRDEQCALAFSRGSRRRGARASIGELALLLGAVGQLVGDIVDESAKEYAA